MICASRVASDKIQLPLHMQNALVQTRPFPFYRVDVVIELGFPTAAAIRRRCSVSSPPLSLSWPGTTPIYERLVETYASGRDVFVLI
jgi:hypothetical protein